MVHRTRCKKLQEDLVIKASESMEDVIATADMFDNLADIMGLDHGDDRDNKSDKDDGGRKD